MNSGFIPGTVSSVATTAGSVLQSVGTATGTATGNTLAALLGGLFVNADGSTNWVTIGVAGVALFAVVEVLGKK